MSIAEALVRPKRFCLHIYITLHSVEVRKQLNIGFKKKEDVAVILRYISCDKTGGSYICNACSRYLGYMFYGSTVWASAACDKKMNYDKSMKIEEAT